MLGVIIGVAAVIAMVAIGQGATQSVAKQIASMGQNQLMIMPGSSSSGAVMFGSGSQQTLSPQDATAIERDCPSAEAVAVIVRTRAQIVYQDMNWAPATVQGCDPAYLTVREWPVVEGEAFTDADLRVAAQVCLVGQTVVDNLFAGEEGEEADRLRDPSHVRNYTEEEWRSFFAEAGLDVEQAHMYEHPVLLEPWLERSGCTGKDAERVRELVAGRTDGDRVRLERICLKGRKRRDG